MNRVIEYQAVMETQQSDFNEVVNALIARGFQPLGGISTCVDEDHLYYTQAMVKYDDKE